MTPRRLTEEELDNVVELSRGRGDLYEQMATELRALRLSDADKEALRFAVKCVESSFNRMKQSVAGHGMSDAVKHIDAIAALDKLLAAGGGGK